MTHYTIKYNQTKKTTKRAAAIRDCKDWLGDERFAYLTEEFRKLDPPVSVDEFQLILSFAGIQGYPAKAMYEHIYGDQT